MRVLQANKFFFAKGGAERYFLDLIDLLPGIGHAVAPFSMRHAQNLPTEFASWFVSEVDYATDTSGLGALRTAARTVYNRETVRQVRGLIREFRPDVAHLHNIHHQLSGSLYEALAAEKVPVVQTLHDFQWVCPVYTFTRDGRVCEECRHGQVWPAVRHRCQRGSLARSVIAALELQVGVWRGWEKQVAQFLAPSAFLGETVVRHGLPQAKVRQLGYCLRLESYVREKARGDHALYAGRLSGEKGVATLIRALEQVPALYLRIAGSGPLERELRDLAARVAPGRVSFLGYLPPQGLRHALSEAAFVVVPSEWYENQPYAVLEAFAMGAPVVGAAIGGIPELIEPGRTGYLFEAGSEQDLARALKHMKSADAEAMGSTARAWVETRFSPAQHLETLTAIYREVAA